ncbi:hypothetical protein vseg_018123 [Gypsophila vaccaria]
MVETKNDDASKKIQVKIISNETLKPSIPTPPERQRFTLNIFDQAFPPLHSHLILFYQNSTSQPVNTTSLKTSLQDTLTCFYPFAGRCEDESTVLCQGQGVPFVVTEVDCQLSEVVNAPNKMELFPMLMPPKDEKFDADKSMKISDLILIAFQVNMFLCGGVAIGCECLHKITDMAALANFFVYWASVARQMPASELLLLEPDMEASVKAFPPSLTVQRMLDVPPLKYMLGLGSPDRVVVRSFTFGNAAIADLQVQATSEGVPKPSRFEALGAFVWEHALAAAFSAGQQVGDTTGVTIFADLRSRTSPPLPKGAFGNHVTQVTARAPTHQGGLIALVTHMRAALIELKTKTEVKSMEDEADYRDMMYKPGFFKISSWCKMGLDEADFGFGKPWIVPTNGTVYPVQRNFIYLTEHPTGNGMDVWLFLEETEMQCLESSPQFLAVAVPC